MKKKLLLLILTVLLNGMTNLSWCSGMPLSGSVNEEDYIQFNKTGIIINKSTGKPVSNAQISIPAKGINTQTDSYGRFNLNASLSSPTILSVNAKGYQPFSLTITEDKANKPLTIGISEKSGREIVIDSALHHLGDDKYSADSANSNDFRSNSDSPYFSKNFYVGSIDKNADIILKIGSIIGLDTEMAHQLGQSKTLRGVSSPTQIYINSIKVGELKINGDNQEISIQPKFLNLNTNNIIIKTGRNLYAQKFVDYDDMEFMNLILEFR